MRLTQGQLRRLIEAESEQMKTPKGPNSRDDGDDDFVEKKPSGTVSEVAGFEPRTADEDVDVHGELVAAGEYVEMAMKRIQRALAADRAQGGILDTQVRTYVQNVLAMLADDQVAETLKSNQ